MLTLSRKVRGRQKISVGQYSYIVIEVLAYPQTNSHYKPTLWRERTAIIS